MKTLPGDQAGEVRHVDHQRRADLVGDLAEDAEVDLARVRAVAGDRAAAAAPRARACAPRRSRAGRSRGRRRSCSSGTACPRRSGRKPCVRWPPASSAMPIIFWLPSSRRSVSQSSARELGDRLLRRALERRVLDARGEHGPERDQVGVDAAVRLHVGVVGAEQRRAPARRRATRSRRRCRSRRRSGGRASPRRTCRSASCPSRAARRARRSSRSRSASACCAGRAAPAGSRSATSGSSRADDVERGRERDGLGGQRPGRVAGQLLLQIGVEQRVWPWAPPAHGTW